jgi:DNA-directed RNA polymerase specialized sigma subunit
MRYIEDQRQRDIGKRIGLSQMQVSRTLRSAIERLQLAADPE